MYTILKKEKIQTAVENISLDQYECNMCTQKILMDHSSDPSDSFQYLCQLNNMHGFSITGGYGNTYPGDSSNISFHLCSDCLLRLVAIFKIPPESKE
jgi:hypothetical protein